MAGVRLLSEGKIAGLYDLERTLGKGHFAVVKLARHVFTGERVAVKVIDKSKLDGGAATQLLQEVRCMKLVQHPNVVRLYEVIDTHSKLYLILELGDGGDMFDHIMRHEGGLAEGQAKHYFAQIVHAISYCHRLHVVHRDLKPENVVFFQEQGVVKLTDFGFSNCFQPGTMLTTSCGSLAYSAPEILLGDEYEAPAVDVWSLGVILYMLVCGQPPFQEANDSETLTMILDCRYLIPPRVSSQCADLISRMLQRNPRERASLEQIEVHPWLQGVDPSPASRSLLPLTSHKRVSEEEHDIIIQAMMCGNIADRETIQEALEANRYNHVTATYFLLAERILREKQEKPSASPSLVYNLAQQVQSRSTFNTVSDPSHPLALADKSPCPPPASKSALEKVAEHSGKPVLCFPALGEEASPSSFHGCGQPIRALIRPALIETPIAKSTPALQQISEEEEEEEEEEEGGKPGLFRRRTSSLNQEQMSAFQSAKASLLFCRSLAAHNKAGKSPAPGLPKPRAPGLALPQAPPSQAGPGRVLQQQQEEVVACRGQGGERALGPPPREGAPGGQACGGSSGPCQQGGEAGGEEDNNNSSSSSSSPQTGAEEELLKQGGCSRLQRVARLAVAVAPEEKAQKLERGLEAGPAGQPKRLGPGSPGGSESPADNIIKLDPAKGKSANLKDRILQFPLCEKALAFRMRPTSKDSLLSLGQFNCCHVI
ncbi:SNF-related serine/threonine-protein kinase-like [Hemicordylus capensis]|uniref:SNF-related serine/threonine-protein kinase-like n=1 Tax=Hemicordylus capensis TaxID=884348 RepID=UPI0023043A4A|nr:SNF-related serine/threonine-protein kinase-like [Hemicordylus capensis]XP_053127524.1 SNF-related serine/threonine-protein kinase-like [Hemicordylus capensis]XP_053127525.1 SNF-related serine/threonine-protein kinase-like [Hemicordylus capensis]